MGFQHQFQALVKGSSNLTHSLSLPFAVSFHNLSLKQNKVQTPPTDGSIDHPLGVFVESVRPGQRLVNTVTILRILNSRYSKIKKIICSIPLIYSGHCTMEELKYNFVLTFTHLEKASALGTETSSPYTPARVLGLRAVGLQAGVSNLK